MEIRRDYELLRNHHHSFHRCRIDFRWCTTSHKPIFDIWYFAPMELWDYCSYLHKTRQNIKSSSDEDFGNGFFHSFLLVNTGNFSIKTSHFTCLVLTFETCPASSAFFIDVSVKLQICAFFYTVFQAFSFYLMALDEKILEKSR